MTTHRVAIVGAGPGGLIAYTALRYRGLADDQVVLVDEYPTPLSAWLRSTSSIAQRNMRSESEGHFFATDFPGFALMEAMHRGSPWPLLKSAFNRYNPTLSDVLRHARALTQHYQLDGRIQAARITRIRRETLPENHFALLDADDRVRFRARHVLLAPGHGSWRWPAACADASLRSNFEGQVFHSYQPKPYGAGTVLVIGSGMAALGEWTNVLRAGGRVVSVRRADQLLEQPLSAPRCAFAGPWLDRYHQLDPEARADTLAGLARGSFPRSAASAKVLKEAAEAGRFREVVGEVATLNRAEDGRVCAVIREQGQVATQSVAADMVIAATGFESGWPAHEVVRNLVADYTIPTYGNHIVLSDDAVVPGISLPESVLAVSGPLAAWAYPAADSFAGMKYTARRFSEYAVGGSRSFRPRPWWGMVRGGWPYRQAVSETPGNGEPCASL